jgi:hypothetical protein
MKPPNSPVATAPVEPAAPRRRAASGTLVVLLVIAVVAAVIVYFALGMPGMDHSPSEPHDMENMLGGLSSYASQ